MKRFWRKHSLSIVLAMMAAVFAALSLPMSTEDWKNLSVETYGAFLGGLVIVVATKYFEESGSAESK